MGREYQRRFYVAPCDMCEAQTDHDTKSHTGTHPTMTNKARTRATQGTDEPPPDDEPASATSSAEGALVPALLDSMWASTSAVDRGVYGSFRRLKLMADSRSVKGNGFVTVGAMFPFLARAKEGKPTERVQMCV